MNELLYWRHDRYHRSLSVSRAHNDMDHLIHTHTDRPNAGIMDDNVRILGRNSLATVVGRFVDLSSYKISHKSENKSSKTSLYTIQ